MISLNISKNVKYWRKRKNLSQRQLAERIGVHYTYICKIENNTRKPSVEVLEEIRAALDLCPKDLFVCLDRSCENCTHNNCKFKHKK